MEEKKRRNLICRWYRTGGCAAIERDLDELEKLANRSLVCQIKKVKMPSPVPGEE